MAKAVIAGGGASTQSRARRPGKSLAIYGASGVHEFAPLVNGNQRKILSWPMAQYGPLLGFPSLDNPLTADLIEDLIRGMVNGFVSLGSYPPELEQRLANKLATLYAPYLRSPDIGVRFFSDGTSTTQAAVALSRYATGRDAFVSVGYHGGSSPVFGFEPQNGGLLPEESKYRYDEEFGGHNWPEDVELACAVIEVPAVEDELLAAKWLMSALDDVTIWGGMSVMDDIVTGFRFAPAGALEYYSQWLGYPLQADFICLGKALSTYGKVSALLGPLEIMEALGDKVFASYTFNDHPFGFADALWTLGEYDKHASRLYEHRIDGSSVLGIGERLKVDLNGLFQQYAFPVKCIGHPARSAIVPLSAKEYFGIEDFSRSALNQNFPQEVLNALLSRVVDEHDILLHRPQFVTLAHNLSHVSQTIEAVEKVLKTL